MKISVKCYATLARYAPEGGVFEAPAGTTAGQLVQALGLEPDDVKILFVNNAHADPARVLADGDRVGLFPAIGGG